MSNVRILASQLAELRRLLRERDQYVEHVLTRLDDATEQLAQLQHYIRELERQLEQQEEPTHGT